MRISDWSSDVCSSDLMHITRLSCDTESFSRTVALYDGNHFRRRAALVQQPPDPKASLEPKRDLDLHIDQLLLVELRVGKRTIELLAIQAVIARCKPTTLGCPARSPRTAVARLVRADKWAL